MFSDFLGCSRICSCISTLWTRTTYRRCVVVTHLPLHNLLVTLTHQYWTAAKQHSSKYSSFIMQLLPFAALSILVLVADTQAQLRMGQGTCSLDSAAMSFRSRTPQTKRCRRCRASQILASAQDRDTIPNIRGRHMMCLVCSRPLLADIADVVAPRLVGPT